MNLKSKFNDKNTDLCQIAKLPAIILSRYDVKKVIMVFSYEGSFVKSLTFLKFYYSIFFPRPKFFISQLHSSLESVRKLEQETFLTSIPKCYIFLFAHAADIYYFICG